MMMIMMMMTIGAFLLGKVICFVITLFVGRSRGAVLCTRRFVL